MLRVMSLNLQYGAKGGRWPGLCDLIRDQAPDVLLAQELRGWADDAGRHLAAVEEDLAMRGQVASSRTGHPTGIFINEATIEWGKWVTSYHALTLHGHSELTVRAPGLSRPIVLISAHLTPSSSPAAAIEAQHLAARAHRERGSALAGYGILGGDVNHLPLDDPEPDWERVPVTDRIGRARMTGGALVGDRSVARVLSVGMTDVAAHLADERGEPELRYPTGHEGRVRADQIWITQPLLPALVSYQRIETGVLSDHDAVVATLDLARVDATS